MGGSRMTSVARRLPTVLRPPQAQNIGGFDVEKLRRDFPILKQKIRGRRLVYLDNAATSQKPQAVIDAISHYYERDNSNVHRGVHYLSERATEEFENARQTVQRFINAASRSEERRVGTECRSRTTPMP